MFDELRKKISRDIVIDFGTANVLVYVEGQGVVLNEPSVVAINVSTDRVDKVGQAAMEMLGRTPDNVEAIRPMKDGSISQYEVTLQMLRYFIRRAYGKVWVPPRVLITVPTGITDVEMRAVMDAAHEAGARRTYLIEEPKAAAIGAGLDIKSPVGSMVVNIGGGVSDIAVLSMGGLVVSDSIRIGGDKFDEAIQAYMRRRYNILIGERTAEDIKIRIGDVYEHKRPKYMHVTGRSLFNGEQREVLISSKETLEALYEPITAILDSICSVIEATPPELVGDILQHGMVLTGGGCLLGGLDRLIERVTGIPTYIAKDPIASTVLGASTLLPYLGTMPEGLVNVPSHAAERAARSGRDPDDRRDDRRDDRDRRDNRRDYDRRDYDRRDTGYDRDLDRRDPDRRDYDRRLDRDYDRGYDRDRRGGDRDSRYR